MIRYNLRPNTSKTHHILQLLRWAGKYWFQLAICFFLLHFYRNTNIQLVVSPQGGGLVSQTEQFSIIPTSAPAQPPAENKSIFNEDKSYEEDEKWKVSDFRNLSFILNPSMAERKKVSPKIVAQKLGNCKNYVERFSKTAVEEMGKYGIPASIKLAQGLLETDAGSSRLASESNNHFGIKCRSKCRGCTCRNYSDDDIYDMFRVFDSVWESYREHSKLLQISRYAHLKNLGTKDYKGWAVGLKKAGYATDKNYHKKLIRIIEVLELHEFDR